MNARRQRIAKSLAGRTSTSGGEADLHARINQPDQLVHDFC